MRTVLDSCVAIKFVLKEDGSDAANKLREEFRHGLHEFLAPDVFIAEVSHALTRGERKNIIPVGEAANLIADILTTLPTLEATLSLLPRAMELASKYRCGFYDCLYVSLAEKEQCQFVTSDQKLIDTFQKDFPNIVDLADLP